MSIIVDADDANDMSQLFRLEKDWLIGQTILLDNEHIDSLKNIFNFNENSEENCDNTTDVHSCSQQIEQIHLLSQQLTEQPNRSFLSNLNSTINLSKKLNRSIIPSQNTLFELAQNKPDSSRWTITFQDNEEEREENISDDDGFQSASSTISDDKLKLDLVPFDQTDIWFRAFTKAENKFFTWEQRGSYIYDRIRPYLFDLRVDNRPFQHLCLLLLLNKPSFTRSPDIDYRPISVEEYLRDLCYMLMSISSETFQWNEANQTYELKSDVYVLGYTQEVIERFSVKYIRSANQFYSIKKYMNNSSNCSETENEFCQALRSYLRYMQKILSIHDIKKYSLVKFAAKVDPILCSLDLPISLISIVNQLEQQIRNTSPNTSIAFIKLSSILHTLLNHNYHIIDRKFFLLLIHFVTYTLRPFLSFLTGLIIHSNYLDRYNEYPILFNHNRLIGLKTSEFWTKTFTIRYLYANNNDTIFHQILPIEYLQHIVNITRSLLLIKLCDKTHPLCSITTNIIPQLKFTYINSRDNIDRKLIFDYQNEMNEKIIEYEQEKKLKRIQIEQAKVQERMDMYARQDELRAQRKKFADDEKQKLIKDKQLLRDQWQEQVDEKRKFVKEEKLAEAMADAEMNKLTSTTTIIGSRLATPYAKLVESVRNEILSEYEGKMRDASEREQQFRNRIQTDTIIETPKQAQESNSNNSSESSPSFHTPAVVDPSPNTVSLSTNIQSNDISSPMNTENINNANRLDSKIPVLFKGELSKVDVSIDRSIIRHTANEETTQPEYRSGIKIIQSNVLKSTIQNYMIDHNPLDETEEEEQLPEKVYDWDAIIANGPQFKYEDSFELNITEKKYALLKDNLTETWFDFDMSPLRIWLEHSILPLIRVQSQLVNRALLNYFFDELNLLSHLNNLRSYYFLATGRFGFVFCSELSRLLLTNDDVRIIYRINSMRQILYTSLDQAGDLNDLIDILQLSSKSNIPNSLSLLDPTLLDYFDLNYRVQWPLNIVITEDMLEKYKIIFRFLLRILIVKQVLNEIWIMLKACKQRNSTLAQLHQYRHQMQHFMTVLINYITNQVMQISWNEFIRKTNQAKHINEIVIAHNEYLDRTMMNCLLTPNAAPILNDVNRVLTLIIRFRCQLKTFSWIINADYTDISDTSVQALRTTFEKYHIAVLSLFKVLSKLAEKGYKTSLTDLLVRLNHNGYYDRLALASIRRNQ